MVELPPDDFGQLRLAVEQVALRVEPEDARVGQDVAMRIEHKGVVPVAGLEFFDFIADHPVQEARGVFATDQEPPTVRKIRQTHALLKRPVFGLALQRANDSADLSVVNRIRDEALNHSQVMKHLLYLTDVHGPRLTNSPGYDAAADWVVEQAKKWGLENAAKEKWGPYGKGWSAQYSSANLVKPQFAPLIAVPLAWAPGTPGVVSGTPIFAPLRRDDDLERYRTNVEKYMAQYKGKLKDQIVLIGEKPEVKVQETAAMRRLSANELSERAAAPEPLEPIAIDLRNPKVPADPQERRRFFAYAPRYVTQIISRQREELQSRFNRFLVEEGVRLAIHPGRRGDGGTIFPPVAASYKADAPIPPPSIALTPEHYNRIVRLLEEKVPVRLDAEVRARFHQETLDSVNVVAEIPGGSKRDELVIIGAHLDSVDAAGTGATDNA